MNKDITLTLQWIRGQNGCRGYWAGCNEHGTPVVNTHYGMMKEMNKARELLEASGWRVRVAI